jgi:ribonuclease-3
MVAAAPPARDADARALAASRNVMAALAESVIGAGWLGPGPAATTSAVRGSFASVIDLAPDRLLDPKSDLQEMVQGAGHDRAIYEITGQDGPPQDRTFHARVTVAGREAGRGSGRSKQAAEQAAAQAALQSMRKGS